MPDTNPWDETFGRIRAVYRPECVYPPLTTAAELDAVEKELGVRLPASYRAFAECFGLGGELHTLPEMLPIVPNPKRRKEGWWTSVTEASRFHRTTDWDPAWLERHPGFFDWIVVFAIDGGYHTWAFDTREVTDPRYTEYRVFDLPRLEEPVPVAASFHAWLEYINREYRFEDEDDDEEEEVNLFPPVCKPDSSAPEPMSYYRSWWGKKEKPNKASVKSWLAWHNGTVLALARSIRDGQRDAFGILADALEDAGCRSPDLLHSCRHGDPDIDGVWALRVLLGE
jgi:hypothetical protein